MKTFSKQSGSRNKYPQAKNHKQCFRVFEDAQRAEGGRHSDGDDDKVSHSGDTDNERRIAQELSRTVRPSCIRSPRRLLSVSPLEILAKAVATRLQWLTTCHADAPAPLASQKPSPVKVLHTANQPQTDPLPAKKVVEKDAFAAATALPHLQSLLQHLLGIRLLPIPILAALGCCPSADGEPRQIPAILNQTPCLVGLEDLKLELRSILFRSINQREGNLISRSLALLSNPLTCGFDGFITIKLNGLVHNTEKVALKEMCCQLFLSLAFAKDSDRRRRLNKVNQDLDFRPKDSADKSKYNEDDEDEDGTFQHGGAGWTAALDQQPKFTNYGKILKNLLDVLEPALSLPSEHERNTQQRKKTSSGKAVVIIVEEFDLFSDLDCQSFIYCLLKDIKKVDPKLHWLKQRRSTDLHLCGFTGSRHCHGFCWQFDVPSNETL
ncbi:hypothetical protein PCANC_19376 [Puccinia coronata f. sp. avenae]|uniref:Uncharacterized protein n=1 Tax=Puccinia coronata f. sp. avenae TaxID=200324 RepID=A0A2N5UPQ8_9BASI|nr:hypothetical protein PCANC_19376 [Puccinia coronata f. sp. avenae]